MRGTSVPRGLLERGLELPMMGYEREEMVLKAYLNVGMMSKPARPSRHMVV